MKSVRQQAILDYVAQREVAPLAELEAHFGVSMSTLRRDLADLCGQGELKKTYGCVSRVPAGEAVVPFHLRSGAHGAEKLQAARVAAGFVEDHDFIFLDSGSTTCLMVEFLQERRDVSIVTNNLDAIMRAAAYPNLKIYVLPGMLNRENNSFSALNGEGLFAGFNVTKVFLACGGLTLRQGVSHTDPGEGELKKRALALTEQRYLVLDETKFGTSAPLRLCGAEEFSTVCTNRAPAREYADQLQALGVCLAF